MQVLRRLGGGGAKPLNPPPPQTPLMSGPSRSLEMSAFDRPHVTSYCTCSITSVVSEIFNVEKSRDLEIPVKGRSRSSKVTPFDRLPMVSY